MSVQNESCPNCGWQFDVLVAEVPCSSCTGLGDTWHYGPLPEPNIQGLLLVEYGHPDLGPHDRDRFTFAVCQRHLFGEPAPDVWVSSGTMSNEPLTESYQFHLVRWQWLRGEPGTPAPGWHAEDTDAEQPGDCPF